MYRTCYFLKDLLKSNLGTINEVIYMCDSHVVFYYSDSFIGKQYIHV